MDGALEGVSLSWDAQATVREVVTSVVAACERASGNVSGVRALLFALVALRATHRPLLEACAQAVVLAIRGDDGGDEKKEEDGGRVREWFGALEELGVVRVSADGAVSLHPVVREILLPELLLVSGEGVVFGGGHAEERKKAVVRGLDAVFGAVLEARGADDYALTDEISALKEAYEQAVEEDPTNADTNIGRMFGCWYRHGWQLMLRAEGDAAIRLFKHGLEVAEARGEGEGKDAASLCSGIAGVLDDQGKYDAALEMYGRALKIREAKLGADHPSVASTLNNMANVYESQGKYDTALEMYGRALDVREVKLGADHPHVATTLNNIAVVYQRQGKYDAALEMFERALKIKQASPDADVDELLNNMATVFYSQRKYDAAMEMYGRALTIKEAKLGADHPSVAMTLNNMAIVHNDQGRYDKAMEMYRRALKIKEAKLEADDLSVAMTLNNMANVYYRQDKFEKAMEMYGRVIQIREAKLGADHPDVATTLNNMANVLHSQGKYDAALEIYRRALRIKEATLGADHPSVADTLYNMSSPLKKRKQGNTEAALGHVHKARAIYERAGLAHRVAACDERIADFTRSCVIH